MSFSFLALHILLTPTGCNRTGDLHWFFPRSPQMEIDTYLDT